MIEISRELIFTETGDSKFRRNLILQIKIFRRF